MAEIGWKNQPTTNQGATAQSTDPMTQGQQQQTATGNPGNNPNTPPNDQSHWQNGAPSNQPGQTQDPQTGQQTGGRWVDPNYQTDATGRQLSAAEQQYWRDYDRRRAEAASIARSNAVGGGNTADGVGVDAPVYDPDTDTFSYRDKSGKWYYGVGAADIYNKMSADVQKQYPNWYFGQYATQQRLTREQANNTLAQTNQNFARMGQQSTRYATTSF